MKVLVLEGNRGRCVEMERLLKGAVQNMEVVACTNTKDALYMAATIRVDLFIICIDVDQENGGLTGIRFLESIRSWDEYFDSYVIVISDLIDSELSFYRRFHCHLFLERPFSKIELQESISQLEFYIKLKKQQRIMYRDKRFHINIDDSIHCIDYSNILLIETHSKYDIIYVTDGESIKVPKLTLKNMLPDIVDNGFMYCNRSEIANIDKITNIDKKEGSIELDRFERKIFLTDQGKKQLKKYMRLFK
ncbi:MAG: LytTR family transcriptional regulator DNA-binding domain-containing protein [Eubacterium sp.]|nr:LytTR family transcriptional regulator DNA-binding domain-containing protein [Eubacterium sp.]